MDVWMYGRKNDHLIMSLWQTRFYWHILYRNSTELSLAEHIKISQINVYFAIFITVLQYNFELKTINNFACCLMFIIALNFKKYIGVHNGRNYIISALVFKISCSQFYDTIRYDSVYLTCSKKLTGSQPSLVYHTE